MEFPSWHLMEEGWSYTAYLFEDEQQYATGISSDRVSDSIDIYAAVDKAVMKFDCIVYEVSPSTFDVIRVLHDPEY